MATTTIHPLAPKPPQSREDHMTIQTHILTNTGDDNLARAKPTQ